MKNYQEEFRYLVFNNLMSLPAYKLNKQYQKIIKTYTYSTLSELIKNHEIQNSFKNSEPENENHTSVELIYQKPRKIKIFKTAVKSFDIKYIKLGILALVFSILAFFTKADSPNLIIIGLISFLVFAVTFFIFFTEFSTWVISTNKAFSWIDIQLNTVDEYIDVFEEIHEKNPDIKADIILECIINDEISGLNYDLWKKELLGFIFAILVSLLYVYLMGNSFLEEIQWIANSLNFGDFEIVKKLSVEILTLTIIFPLGLRSGNYIYVSALKNRNKRLRQSLKIVQSRIQKPQD